jgi:hypothetical protein
VSEFFKTLMGRKFFERDVPELVRQLEKLNTILERGVVALERLAAPKPGSEQ